MKSYELKAIYDNQASFYGKAVVIEDGGRLTLKSYNTDVAEIRNGEFVRLWPGYSSTTMRHVVEFCRQNCVKCGGKAWWNAQAVEA